MKKCPFCSEEILDDATKCKHCGSDLSKKPKVTIVFGLLLWGVIAYFGFRIVLSFFSPEIPETEIERLTKSFSQECISEANSRGYSLEIIDTKPGYITGKAQKSGINTSFGCKKTSEDGSISLTGSKLDLRIQTR